jgi:hypothetical protein
VLIEHEDLLAAPEAGIAAAVGCLAPLVAALSPGIKRTW